MNTEAIAKVIENAVNAYWNKESSWASSLSEVESATGFPRLVEFVESTVIHGDQTSGYAAERITLHSQKRKVTNESEMLGLVKEIRACEGTEAYSDYLVDVFERHCKHPDRTDLIFYSEEELSPSEIARLAWNGS
ncbi:MAG: bacteriocin immunity protein [Planctomycetota bacterium]